MHRMCKLTSQMFETSKQIHLHPLYTLIPLSVTKTAVIKMEIHFGLFYSRQFFCCYVCCACVCVFGTYITYSELPFVIVFTLVVVAAAIVVIP